VGSGKNLLKGLSFFPPRMAQQPLPGQGLLIGEASRSHSDTLQDVDIFWTSDQPVAGRPLPDSTQLTLKRQLSMPPAGFEPEILASKRPQIRTGSIIKGLDH
jgi:hypothetical protein